MKSDTWVMLVAGIILLFAGLFWFKTINFGRNEADYEQICLHGHIYYFASFGMKAILAPRINPHGGPVPCHLIPK